MVEREEDKYHYSSRGRDEYNWCAEYSTTSTRHFVLLYKELYNRSTTWEVQPPLVLISDIFTVSIQPLSIELSELSSDYLSWSEVLPSDRFKTSHRHFNTTTERWINVQWTLSNLGNFVGYVSIDIYSNQNMEISKKLSKAFGLQ